MATPRQVLVTGVTGYLGSRLVPRLLDDGHEVRVLTRDAGGPDVLTYREMIVRFARISGLRRRLIVTVPVLTPRLASLWVGFVTPVPAAIARPLVGSLVHEVVCGEHDIDDLVGPPPGGALSYDVAVQAAVAGDRADPRPEPGTVDPARLTAADPAWAGGRLVS